MWLAVGAGPQFCGSRLWLQIQDGSNRNLKKVSHSKVAGVAQTQTQRKNVTDCPEQTEEQHSDFCEYLDFVSIWTVTTITYIVWQLEPSHVCYILTQRQASIHLHTRRKRSCDMFVCLQRKTQWSRSNQNNTHRCFIMEDTAFLTYSFQYKPISDHILYICEQHCLQTHPLVINGEVVVEVDNTFSFRLELPIRLLCPPLFEVAVAIVLAP